MECYLKYIIPEWFFIIPTSIHIAPQPVIDLKSFTTHESITVFWMVGTYSKIFDTNYKTQYYIMIKR